MTRRLVNSTLIAGLLATAALAAPAAAATPKFGSQVHMHAIGPSPDYDHWMGDVHSRKRRCQRGRTVTVFYQFKTGPEAVDSDVTDRRGHWAIPTAAPGTNPYYAQVTRKVVGRGDRRIVCKADRSPEFGFPPPF